MISYKSSKDLYDMSENLSPISIVQQLHQHDLFYFTPRMLADLFALDIGHVYRLVASLKESGLVLEAEKGKYLTLARSECVAPEGQPQPPTCSTLLTPPA
jgi:hypothetical protein